MTVGMAQKTEGIQQLLIAEKRATERVVDARKRKAQRIKAAKREADTDIQSFKSEKESQYKGYEAEMLGKKSDNEIQIQQVTGQKVKELDGMLNKNQGDAHKSVGGMLFQIDLQLHENVKL